MNDLTTLSAVLALVGSALVGGIFFAFSSFIMKALAHLPAAWGIRAMQSINIMVLNPAFLGAFMGTTVISLLLSVLAINTWQTAAAPYYLTGALLYLIGTFLVTGLGNVPLNNQLATVSDNDPTASDTWRHYLDRWTRLNTLRTVCAMAAALVLIAGLLK